MKLSAEDDFVESCAGFFLNRDFDGAGTLGQAVVKHTAGAFFCFSGGDFSLGCSHEDYLFCRCGGDAQIETERAVAAIDGGGQVGIRQPAGIQPLARGR